MPLVDIDDKLKAKVEKQVKKDKATYPTIKHFVNTAISEKLGGKQEPIESQLRDVISLSGDTFNKRLEEVAQAIAANAFSAKTGTYKAIGEVGSVDSFDDPRDSTECAERTEIELIVKVKQIKPDKRGRSPCWWCNKKTSSKDSLKRPMCLKCQKQQCDYVSEVGKLERKKEAEQKAKRKVAA